MKKFKTFLFIVLGLIAIFLIVAMLMPKDYKVERSIVIDAPEGVVVNQITMFKHFQQWSPWSELDPNMEFTIEGEDGQVGAKYSWTGNDDVGVGSMEITEKEANRVDIELYFKEPWESQATTYYSWNTNGSSTEVVWGMNGKNPIPMNLFLNMDKMIGPDYEKGLQALKERSEAIQAKTQYGAYAIEEVNMPEKNYLIKKGTISMSEIPMFLADNFGTMMTEMTKGGFQPTGAPASLYFEWDEENQSTTMAAAIPCEKSVAGYELMPVGGKMIKTVYQGAYDDMMPAYMAMDEYLKEKGLEMGGPVLEEYVTDPAQESDTSKWITNIYFAVK